MDCKIKDSHYKNSRFSTKKEKDLNQFKKDKISQDLDNAEFIAQDNIQFFW